MWNLFPLFPQKLYYFYLESGWSSRVGLRRMHFVYFNFNWLFMTSNFIGYSFVFLYIFELLCLILWFKCCLSVSLSAPHLRISWLVFSGHLHEIRDKQELKSGHQFFEKYLVCTNLGKKAPKWSQMDFLDHISKFHH